MDNRLYAAKLLFSHPLAGAQVTLGGEYGYVNRQNGYWNREGILADDDSRIKDNSWTLFVDYARALGTVQLQGGVRYEHITSDYYESGVSIEEQSRKYDYLFPSLALAFPVGKVRMQFSYRASIYRPSYFQLRSSVTYVNRYTYEGGNPHLQPVVSQNLSFNSVYKWVYLSSGFRRSRNPLVQCVRLYTEKDPTVGILSFEHMRSYSMAYASLMLSPAIGRWYPSWGIQMMQYWYPASTPQGERNFDHPLGFFSWNNAFKLPGGVWLNVDAYCNTRGEMENIELLKADCFLNLKFYKGFLDDRLSMQLQVDDLFGSRTNHARQYSGIRVMEFDQECRCSFGFTLRYKFNPSKSKYRGTGAGEGQKSRL